MQEDGAGDPMFEFNGLWHLWRQLEGQLRLVVDVGSGAEPTFPDGGSVVQHCFEPLPKAFAKLELYKRPHIKVNKMALGHKQSSSEPFYTHGETLHFRTVLGCSAGCDCKIAVEMTTLDRYFPLHEELDLLNISVSGNERNVLLGSAETLKRTKLVLIEYGGTYADAQVKLSDVLDLLQGHDFRQIYVVGPKGLAPVERAKLPDDHVLRYLLFARSEHDLIERFKPRLTPEPVVMPGIRFHPLPAPHILKETTFGQKGFNLSLLTTKSGFMGTIRRTENPNGDWGNSLSHSYSERKYPETRNLCFLLRMDADFKLLSETEMKEVVPRTKHQSYSTGPEDCRLIDEGCMLATTLDTNPDWRAEVSFLRFKPETGEITQVEPLSARGLDKSETQKNWLVLQRWGDELHVLQWCNPLRIVRVNVTTNQNQVLMELATAFNSKAHGGAAIKLPGAKGFLITVREFRRSHYVGSRWLQLDPNYQLTHISPPFRFQNAFYYEMCMSLTYIPKTKELLAAVSLEDKHQKIYTLLLPAVLRSLRPAF